jgi:hypothetical protein
MKKIILIAVFMLSFSNSNAQVANKFRVDLGLGFIPVGGIGLQLFLEPKYNIKQNMNVGLKFGSAGIVKNISGNNPNSSTNSSATIGAVGSYTGTFDYYFYSGKNFVPYLGGGIGYNQILNVRVLDSNNTQTFDNLSPESVVGGLLRGGFETGKFRMELEYNLLPKSSIVLENGTNFGNTSNSYLALNFGFFIGGGKWKK